MKRYLIPALGVIAALFAASQPDLLVAQEEEGLEYSWGLVNSVSSDQIIVTEYDYDAREEVDIAYAIDPKVELEGVDSLKDITVGDSVEIDYLVRDGENVAKIISVEKSSPEEDYTLPEAYQEKAE